MSLKSIQCNSALTCDLYFCICIVSELFGAFTAQGDGAAVMKMEQCNTYATILYSMLHITLFHIV